MCVFVIDLDGFKNINDIYGHKIGDTVIARTAEQIRVAVGPSAFVARTGGEEFVVLDLLTLHGRAAIAESIRAAIEAPETPKATASIGVAVGADHQTSRNSRRFMPAPTKRCTQRNATAATGLPWAVRSMRDAGRAA